jgi:hypothetical protein
VSLLLLNLAARIQMDEITQDLLQAMKKKSQHWIKTLRPFLSNVNALCEHAKMLTKLYARDKCQPERRRKKSEQPNQRLPAPLLLIVG